MCTTTIWAPPRDAPLEEDAEVLVEEDVGVEHDRAPGHLPCAIHLAQQILAAAGEELMIRLQVRAVHQKRGLGLDLAILQRRHLEVADQVTGARRGILGPGHPAIEPGHPHLEIALVLLEDRQISERRQLAVRFPARDVLAAGHEVEDIVGEEIEPLLELALVEQPSFPDVERHQLEPQNLLRCQRHRRRHWAGRFPRALRLHRIAASYSNFRSSGTPLTQLRVRLGFASPTLLNPLPLGGACGERAGVRGYSRSADSTVWRTPSRLSSISLFQTRRTR